jgi:hypothetical protein
VAGATVAARRDASVNAVDSRPPAATMADWDELLAYTTVKLVRVHDKRLGILHYSFTALILAYIVGYVCLYNKEYMLVDTPEGTVRLGLLPPRACPAEAGGQCEGFRRASTELPYCTGGPVVPGLLMPEPFECRYEDESFAVWPPVEQRGFFAATRITQRDQQLPDGCDPGSPLGPRPDPACFDWEPADPGEADTVFYTAQIETFTAFIDHTMTASRLSLSYSWPSEGLLCRGIFDSEGNKIEPCDDYGNVEGCRAANVTLETGQRNIVPLKTLLRAAGITDLDTAGDVSCESDEVSAGCESFRYSGLVLQVNIEYNNKFSFDSSQVEYKYTVDHVKESEFQANEIMIESGGAAERTVNNRHGIRVVFRQIGEVGRFDAQTFLINLVTALGLLAAATTFVDALMVNVLPQKKLYTQAKVQEVSVLVGDRGGGGEGGSNSNGGGGGNYADADSKAFFDAPAGPSSSMKTRGDTQEPLLNSSF